MKVNGFIFMTCEDCSDVFITHPKKPLKTCKHCGGHLIEVSKTIE